MALLLLPVADAAFAGAWPRSEGAVFLSFSGEVDRDGNTYSSIYGEYGLAPRNTLGWKLDHTDAGDTGALVWLQRALDDGSGPDRWAVSLGIGAVERDGTLFPQGQLGASWGRGFDGRLGTGWLAVDLRLNIVEGPGDDVASNGLDDTGYLGDFSPETSAKADATLGLHLTPTTMFINQIQLEERQDSGFSGKLATTVVHDLAGPARIEFGIVTPLSGDGEPSVKIGTWLEF